MRVRALADRAGLRIGTAVDMAALADYAYRAAVGREFPDAFRWAHQADPRVKQFLDDYDNEGVNPESDAYYTWVPGVLDGEGSATPYDENLSPKPAYAALRDTLALAGR